MPIKVREGNIWKEVANDIAVPDIVTGTYTHYTSSTRYVGGSFQNQTTKLLHVNATVGLDRAGYGYGVGSGEQSYGAAVAGTYCRAWIAEESSNLNSTNGTEVAFLRDNGSWATDYIFLNPQFFVPVGYWYKIQLYDYNNNVWSSSNTASVNAFTWSELTFELQ